VPEPTADTPQCFIPREILPFAFLPDNTRLLIRTGSGVQVFNLETLQEESFFEAPQNVYATAISPDGGTLAWSLEDNTIQLVRLSDQQPLATLTGHPDIVYHLRFSPAGDRLYSASHDGVVRIWDLEGNLFSSIEAGGEVLGMGVSPDGTRLATIPFDGPLALWDTASWERVAEFGSTVGYDTSDAVFSPDGQYLAADLATGIYLWRVSDGELLWDAVKNSMAVAFSPDGRFLAYSDVDADNQVVLASPDGAQIMHTIGQLPAPVWELFFSLDGSRLAATDGVEIYIWQVESGKLIYIGKTSCP
jgi:WD40 repeat protein